MSKRPLTLLVVVALAAGAGLLASQRYFRAEVATKPAVASFSLLPTPTLSLAQTTITGGDGAGGRVRLGIDRIDLRLRALPLLRGEVSIGDIRLVRPVLEVVRASAEAASPPADGSSGSSRRRPR